MDWGDGEIQPGGDMVIATYPHEDHIGGLVTLLLRRDESVQVVIPATDLPGVSEGNILQADVKGKHVVDFFVEEDLTAQKRKRIQDKLKKLQKKR